MTEDINKRKKIFYLVVLFLTLVTMIIGATLAYYNLVSSQKKEGTSLYTGYLKIEYVDGTYIKNPTLYPVKNVYYETYQNVYRNTFSIVSSGTLNQTLVINMDVTTNEFSPNALKYAVYTNMGNEIKRGNVPQSGEFTLVDNIYLTYNGKATYTLIIWLEDNGKNQIAEASHLITGKIVAYSKQTKY